MTKKAKTPQIRFKGFTDAWEQRKLGEISPLRGGFAFQSNKFKKEGIPIVKISNILPTGDVGGDFDYYEELLDDSNFILPDGAAVLAMSGATTGKVSILKNNPKTKAYQNQRVGYFTQKNDIDYSFIKTITRSSLFGEQLRSVLVAGAQPNVSSKDIDNFEFYFSTSTTEQQKIGTLFSNLDNLITLHQRKLEKLKNVKKSLLEKMFPKNGSVFPEIRFKGFTDTWELRKLGDCAGATYGGGTPKTSVESYWQGSIPWLQSQDLVEDQVLEVKPRKHISKEAVANSATKIVPENSIAIVTRVGVGKVAFLAFPYCTSQDFLSLADLSINGDFSTYSIFKMLQNEKWKVQGTSIKGITIEELLEKQIAIPIDSNEQQKIGTLFSNLDNLITLYQRKLEKLKNVKKSLLEKMFV